MNGCFFIFCKDIMKVSCIYCGRIREKKLDCGKRPARVKRRYEKEVFRSSYAWQKKNEEIKRRDNYLCQFCLRNIIGTKKRINGEKLSVHHAIPLKEAYELRLDNENLITTCDVHHELAESWTIPLSEVQKIIMEQEEISPRSEVGLTL